MWAAWFTRNNKKWPWSSVDTITKHWSCLTLRKCVKYCNLGKINGSISFIILPSIVQYNFYLKCSLFMYKNVGILLSKLTWIEGTMFIIVDLWHELISFLANDFPLLCLYYQVNVLILDGSLEHVAHVWRKTYTFH